jgi:hypothetical protein
VEHRARVQGDSRASPSGASWEYISPYNLSTTVFSSDIFRAYRYPYAWALQLDTPVQRAVLPPANAAFRIEPVGP